MRITASNVSFELGQTMDWFRLEATRFPSRRLEALFNSGFTKFEGCVFLARLLARCKNAELSGFLDRTGYECYVNHIHLDDYYKPTRDDGQDEISMAIWAAARLGCRLRAFDSRILYKIIISIGEGLAVLRFHVHRGGESWLEDDLGAYEEKVIVLECAEEESK